MIDPTKLRNSFLIMEEEARAQLQQVDADHPVADIRAGVIDGILACIKTLDMAIKWEQEND